MSAPTDTDGDAGSSAPEAHTSVQAGAGAGAGGEGSGEGGEAATVVDGYDQFGERVRSAVDSTTRGFLTVAKKQLRGKHAWSATGLPAFPR